MRIVLISLSILLFAGFMSCDNEKDFNSNLPEELVGLDIQYKYANDREYNVKLEEEGLSYRYVSGSKPEKWWGPFPYHHYELEDELQVIAWFEEGYGDYVTLIINLDEKTLFGSAIIQGKDVHFEPAKINKLVIASED